MKKQIGKLPVFAGIADERLSPSEMLMRRRLRTTLNAVIPDHTTAAREVTSASKNYDKNVGCITGSEEYSETYTEKNLLLDFYSKIQSS